MIDFTRAEVAQVVEQRTENPRVSSSILLLGIGGSSSVVERLLAKEEVAGSNPVFRSMRRSGGMVDAAVSKTVGGQLPCRFESDLRHDKSDAELCSGSTGDFGSLSPGSNPGSAALYSSVAQW